MAEFLMCVDVGNSRTKFGLFSRDAGPPRRACLPDCMAATAVAHGQLVNWDKLRREFEIQRDDIVRGFLTGSNPEGVGVIRRRLAEGLARSDLSRRRLGISAGNSLSKSRTMPASTAF